jgi:hypothetical protein
VELMSNNIEKAKEIFIKYGGSNFHMEREGEYEFYKSFNITKKEEIQWIREYHKKVIIEIESENKVSIFTSKLSELSNSIILFKDIESFKSMIDTVKEKSELIDSFSQLRIAEEIYSIVNAFSKSEVKKDNALPYAKKIVLDILNRIIKEPITVDEDYKNVQYLKDVLNENRIINRIQRLIKTCNENWLYKYK